jgi:hypothetical protein
MDRISRLEYLERLTREAPSNPVELYADKYKRGELSIKQMKSKSALDGRKQERYIEVAGYVQALENVNQSRSSGWRILHPFKNNAEIRESALMKKAFVEEIPGGEELYREAAAAACRTFVGHQRVNANLKERMIHAKEEMSRKQKMNDVMRESMRIEDFKKESLRELSPRVDSYIGLAKEKQI